MEEHCGSFQECRTHHLSRGIQLRILWPHSHQERAVSKRSCLQIYLHLNWWSPLHWAVDILETWERELDSTLNLNHMSFLQLGADGHGDLDNVKPRPCALGLPKSIMYLWLDTKFGTALWSETWITAKKLFSRSHRTTRQQPAHTTKEAAVCNQSTPVPCGEGNVISLTSYKHSFIFILRYFIHFEFTFVLGDYIRVWFHSSKYRYTVFFVPFLRTPFFLKCLFLSCLSKVMYTTLQGYVSGSFIL